jgi:hypothetical protein
LLKLTAFVLMLLPPLMTSFRKTAPDELCLFM